MTLVRRTLGGMTPRPSRRALEALERFSFLNAGDLEAQPLLQQALGKISRIMGSLVLDTPGLPGVFTSGASESNLLALYALRERGFRRAVFFESAHYSVKKAARILGMETLKIPCEEGFLPRLDLLEDNLGPRDVLVATLGTTEHGFIDPLPTLIRLAENRGARVHVDAAYAGPIARFLGNPKARAEARGALASVAVDLHKIPEAPVGSGLLLVVREELLGEMRFPAPYIPSGGQWGVLGTRPGGVLVASLVALEEFLARGPPGVAVELMEAARHLVEELEPLGFTLAHPLETPVLCLRHERAGLVWRRLWERGFAFYRCEGGRGLRVALLPHSLEELGEIVGLLRVAVRGV